MSDFFVPDDQAVDTSSVPADFEIRVVAASFAEGAAGSEVTDADRAHARNFVKGLLSQIDAGLPVGWSVHITELAETSNQTIFTGNPRKTQPAPELPPDRLARIQTAICDSCGGSLVSQGDDVWVHEQICIEPEPREGSIVPIP